MRRSMKKKLITMNSHCIRFLTITLVVMVNLSASIGRNWNHHDHKNGEIKWAPNCDFPEGHVIKKAKDVTQEECGSRCLDHPRCTHFSFMADKCVLKEIESEVKVTNDGGFSRCGFVSRREIITENLRSTAQNNFVNQNDKNHQPKHTENSVYAPSASHHSSNNSSSSVIERSVLPSALNHTETFYEFSIGFSALNSKALESSTEHQNSTTSSAHHVQINISSSSLKNESFNLHQPTQVPSVSGPDQHEISSDNDKIGNGSSQFRSDSLNASSTAINPVHASSTLNQESSGSSLQDQSNSPTIASPTEASHLLGEMGTSQHYSTPLSKHQKETSGLNSINISSIRHDQLIEHSSEPALHHIEANHYTNQSYTSLSSLLHQSNLSQPANVSMDSSIHEQISRNHSIFNEFNESSTVDPIAVSAPNQRSSDQALAGDHHSITSTINSISTYHSSTDGQSNNSTTANHVVNTSNSDHPMSNSHSSFKEESNESSNLNQNTNVWIRNQDASTDQITSATDPHNKGSTISSIHFQATNNHSSVQVQQNMIPTINPSQTSYGTNQFKSNHSTIDDKSKVSNFDSLIHRNPITNSHSSLNETSTAPSTVNPATISLIHNQATNNHSLMQDHGYKTMTTTHPIQLINDSNQPNTTISSSVDGHLNLHPTLDTTINSSLQDHRTSTLSPIKANMPHAFSTLSQTTKSSDAHDQLDARSSLGVKGHLFSTGNQPGTSSNPAEQTSTSKPYSSQDSENQSSTAENLIDPSYIHELASRTTSSLPNERNHSSMSTSSSIELSSPSNQANDSSMKSFSLDQSDLSSTASPTTTSSTPNQSSTSASSSQNEPSPAFTENNLKISPYAASSTDNPTKLTSFYDIVSNKDESSKFKAHTNLISSTPSVSDQIFTNPQLLEDHLNVSSFNNSIDTDSSVPLQTSTSRSQPNQSFSSLNNPIETSSVSQELTNQPQLPSTINSLQDSSILDHDGKTISYTVSSIRNNSISNQVEMKGKSSFLPDQQNVVSTLDPLSVSSNRDQIKNDTYLSRDAQTQLATTDSSKISVISEETIQFNLTTAYSTKSVSLPEEISNTSKSDLSTTINQTSKSPSVTSSAMVSSHSNWNIDENGQIKWSRECTYWGNDIQEKEGIPEEGCGRICLAIRKCTHFVWVEDDICLLKEFKKPVKEKRIQGTIARCGFVVHRQPVENPLQQSTERRLMVESISTPGTSTLPSSTSISSTPIKTTTSEYTTKPFTSTVSPTPTSTSSIPSTTTLPPTTQQIIASTLPATVMTSSNFFENTIADDQKVNPTSNSHKIIDEVSHDPSSSLEWNIDLDGQIKWAKECDFSGQYAYNEEADVLEENCASVCLEDPKCTHFKWIDDFCFLKEIKKRAIARPNDMIPRCGFVVERKITENPLVEVTSPPTSTTYKTLYENKIDDDQQTSSTSKAHETITGKVVHDPYSSLDWNIDLDGQVKWAKDCNFNGHYAYDEEADVLEENCASVCLEDPKCTHFKWIDDFCFLKEIKKYAIAKHNDVVPRCGFIVSRQVTESPLESAIRLSKLATTSTIKPSTSSASTYSPSTPGTSTDKSTSVAETVKPISTTTTPSTSSTATSTVPPSTSTSTSTTESTTSKQGTIFQGVFSSKTRRARIRSTARYTFSNLGKNLQEHNGQSTVTSTERPTTVSSATTSSSISSTTPTLSQENTKSTTMKHVRTHGSTLLKLFDTESFTSTSTTPIASGRNLEIVWKNSNCQIPGYNNHARKIDTTFIYRKDDCAKKCLDHLSCVYFLYANYNCDLYESSPWNPFNKFEWKSALYQECSCGIVINREMITPTSTTSSTTKSPTSTSTERTTTPPSTSTSTIPKSIITAATHILVPGSSSSFESGRAIKWKDSADCRTLRIHNTSNQITIPDIDDCAERCLARASCLYFNMLDDPTNVCVLYESSPWEIPLKFEWKESRYNLRCGIIVIRDISTNSKLVPSSTHRSTDPSTSLSSTTSKTVGRTTTTSSMTTTTTPPKTTITVTISPSSTGVFRRNDLEITWKNNDCHGPKIFKPDTRLAVARDLRRDECAQKCFAHVSCTYFNHYDYPSAFSVCLLFDSSPWDIPIKFQWDKLIGSMFSCGIIPNRSSAMALNAKLLPSYDQRSTGYTTSASSTTVSPTNIVN